MNKAETIAFEILKQRYPEDEIIFQSSKSPDFICSRTDRYEVKRLYGPNTLLFSPKQTETLMDEDRIMVIDTEKEICAGEFQWGNRNKVNFKINMYQKPKVLQITVSDRIYDILTREAKKRDIPVLNYAGMLLSKTTRELDSKRPFNDGFG